MIFRGFSPLKQKDKKKLMIRRGHISFLFIISQYNKVPHSMFWVNFKKRRTNPQKEA